MASSARYRPWRMPDDTPEHLAPAWVGCVSSAFGDTDIFEQFRAAAYDNWRPEKTGSAHVIDDAFVRGFIDWVNSNMWDRSAQEVRRSASRIP
jgi:hypothetical protein